jgi:hypothetical protein
MGTIIFIALIYAVAVLLIRDVVKSDIRYYQHYSWGYISSETAHTFVSRNEKKIINAFSLIFPIYFGYKFGCQCGIELYKILVDKNYENRIIAWLF